MNILEFIHLLPGISSRNKTIRAISSILYVLLFSSWIVSIFFTAYVNYLSKTVIDIIRLVESKKYPIVQFEELAPKALKVSRTNLIERPVKDSALFILSSKIELPEKKIRELPVTQPKYVEIAPIRKVYKKKEIQLQLQVHKAAELKIHLPAKYNYLTFEKTYPSPYPKKKFIKKVNLTLRNPNIKITQIVQAVYEPLPELETYKYRMGAEAPIKLVPVAKNGFKKLVWDEGAKKIRSISEDIVYPTGKRYGRIKYTPIKAELRYEEKAPIVTKKEDYTREVEISVGKRYGQILKTVSRKEIGVAEVSPTLRPVELLKEDVRKAEYRLPQIRVPLKKERILEKKTRAVAVTPPKMDKGLLMPFSDELKLEVKKQEYDIQKPSAVYRVGGPLAREVRLPKIRRLHRRPPRQYLPATPTLSLAKKMGLIKRGVKLEKAEVRPRISPFLSRIVEKEPMKIREPEGVGLPQVEKEGYIVQAGAVPAIIRKELLKKREVSLETMEEGRQLARVYTNKRKVMPRPISSPNENIKLMEKEKVIFRSEIRIKEKKMSRREVLFEPNFIMFGVD